MDNAILVFTTDVSKISKMIGLWLSMRYKQSITDVATTNFVSNLVREPRSSSSIVDILDLCILLNKHVYV